MLLGKNELDNARVGNLILGRDAFLTEALEVSGENQSERIRGQVKGRPITVINSPDLFDPQLTQDQIETAVNECMSLSAPGPHAFLLVLEPDNFSEEDRNRVKNVLNLFSDKAANHTIALITVRSVRHLSAYDAQEETPFTLTIKDCKMRQHMFGKIYKYDRNQVVQLIVKIDKMVKENGGHISIEKTGGHQLPGRKRRRQSDSDSDKREKKISEGGNLFVFLLNITFCNSTVKDLSFSLGFRLTIFSAGQLVNRGLWRANIFKVRRKYLSMRKKLSFTKKWHFRVM